MDYKVRNLFPIHVPHFTKSFIQTALYGRMTSCSPSAGCSVEQFLEDIQRLQFTESGQVKPVIVVYHLQAPAPLSP